MADTTRPPVRLADVAAAAGVSTALVSIVIRGVPGASEATRARILQVAADLGYQPDQRARLLRQQTPRVIGVAFEVQQAFHGDLVEGIYAAAEALDYDVVLSAVAPGRPESRAVETLLRDRCQALILLGPHAGNTQLQALAAQRPVVLVARPWRGDPATPIDSVTVDDEEGAVLATEHLIALGHRRIVHLDGRRLPGAAERRRGYRRAMRRHALDPVVEPGGADEEAGARAITLLLTQNRPPTAVFAFNDRCALGVLDTLLRTGVAVPQQMSVIGYDNSRLSRIAHIDLTSIDQNPTELARRAVARALARIAERAGPSHRDTVAPVLIQRSTTGPAPAR